MESTKTILRSLVTLVAGYVSEQATRAAFSNDSNENCKNKLLLKLGSWLTIAAISATTAKFATDVFDKVDDTFKTVSKETEDIEVIDVNAEVVE